MPKIGGKPQGVHAVSLVRDRECSWHSTRKAWLASYGVAVADTSKVLVGSWLLAATTKGVMTGGGMSTPGSRNTNATVVLPDVTGPWGVLNSVRSTTWWYPGSGVPGNPFVIVTSGSPHWNGVHLSGTHVMQQHCRMPAG